MKELKDGTLRDTQINIDAKNLQALSKMCHVERPSRFRANQNFCVLLVRKIQQLVIAEGAFPQQSDQYPESALRLTAFRPDSSRNRDVAFGLRLESL